MSEMNEIAKAKMKIIEPKIIAVDFDGTCVTHAYPEVGKEIGAVFVLWKLQEHGHKLILSTMRSHKPVNDLFDRGPIVDAIKWFYNNGIKLWAVNENPNQSNWTTSPKIYAHLYIGDDALGCPIKFDSSISERPFVDWKEVERLLKAKNYIK